MLVECEGSRAFAKRADNERAAHEKIASDLAAEIGLRVPPVCLYRAPDGRKYSISAAAFPQALSWREAGPALSSEFLRNALPFFAAGSVFHTWIDDRDHFGHSENLLVDGESEETDPRLAFIDHAFSMSAYWSTTPAPIQIVQPYYRRDLSLRPGDLLDALERVGNVTEWRINEIVRRIPSDFLHRDLAEIISINLISRREQIRGVFGF